jgi:hypothetical protein
MDVLVFREQWGLQGSGSGFRDTHSLAAPPTNMPRRAATNNKAEITEPELQQAVAPLRPDAWVGISQPYEPEADTYAALEAMLSDAADTSMERFDTVWAELGRRVKQRFGERVKRTISYRRSRRLFELMRKSKPMHGRPSGRKHATMSLAKRLRACFLHKPTATLLTTPDPPADNLPQFTKQLGSAALARMTAVPEVASTFDPTGQFVFRILHMLEEEPSVRSFLPTCVRDNAPIETLAAMSGAPEVVDIAVVDYIATTAAQ